MRSRGELGRALVSTVVQAIALVGLAVLTVILCVLAFANRGEPAPESSAETQATSAPAGSDSPSLEATSSPPEASTPTDAPVPQIKDQRRADFTAGDDLPDGSRIFDSSTSSGMAVRDGVLVHGPPEGTAAASYLETRLGSDVSKLGARVRFAADSSGSVALVAWPSSMVDAGRADEVLPSSGMRLIATSSAWKLTVGADREVIGEGAFADTNSVVSFEVVRDEADLWLTDPTGNIVHVSDPRVAEFAGPWACWELFETAAQQAPAAFEAVWAG